MSNSDKNSGNSDLTHVVSPYSISVYAEAAGHSNVSDEALSFLSFNVTEVLYEILKVSDFFSLPINFSVS